MEQASTITIAGRVSPDLAERAKKAADRKVNPYAPTLSQIVARGLELALQELDKKRPR